MNSSYSTESTHDNNVIEPKKLSLVSFDRYCKLKINPYSASVTAVLIKAKNWTRYTTMDFYVNY